jgi:endonuclease YncB( thermonuclease family)
VGAVVIKPVATHDFLYVAEVLSVHDGDTFTAMIRMDLGFRFYWSHQINVRVIGVDCPELDESGGEEAHEFTQGLLPIGAPVKIKTKKTRAGEDVPTLDRWVAEVTLPDGRDLSAVLLETDHAVLMKR